MDRESLRNYRGALVACVIIAVAGIIMGDCRTIPQGMKTIFYNNALLITDYVALVGTAVAFLNVSLVMFFSMVLMWVNKLPMNGKGIFTIGLMGGFAFFGKNIYTMWPILLGTYLLSKFCKEKFSNHLILGLLATSLGPAIGVAYLFDGVGIIGVLAGLLVGIIIGVVIPLLAVHTAKLLNGYNLYNGGFAVGLLALILVPVMQGFKFTFEHESVWSTGNNGQFAPFLYLIAAVCIITGYLSDKENAFRNYLNILKRPGVTKDDFLSLDGIGAVMVNMGVNIIVCVSYILIIGGDLNGPTMGGILTIMGFSANGKHVKNIVPIMIGVFIGSVINPSATPKSPGVQMAVFLGTTLAPIAGTYGFLPGVFAGIFHSFTVLKIGIAYAAANLYNNGFCGGIVSVVLFPVYDKFFKKNTYSEPSPSRIREKF